MSKNDRKSIRESEKVADKIYDAENYKSNDQAEKGIAITHEQVSDNYMEGTIDGKIDKLNNRAEVTSRDGEEIPRKGYE